MSIIREIDKGEEKESLESKVRNNFKRAQIHQQDLIDVKIVKSVLRVTVDLLTTVSGFLPFTYDLGKHLCVLLQKRSDAQILLHLGENEIVVCILFTFLQNVFNTLVELPWSLYHDFVIEEKWG